MRGTGSRRQVRVAAAQISAGIFDSNRAVDRLIAALDDASHDGIDLLVFPECFIGGYPYWRGHVSVKEGTELGARLWESSIFAEGPESEAIAQASRRSGVAVVVGCNERDARPGSMTAYNSILVFSPEVGLVGCRRKLIPTHTERAYWGRGDAADVRTFTLPFGEVGALVCYEHHMLSARLAMGLLGEEIHCALWPGYWQTMSHIADKKAGPATQAAEIDALVRNYAMSSQNFVISANAFLNDSDIPSDLTGKFGYNLARGGSSVVDASGRYLAPPRFDEEGIVSADVDFWDRALTKSYLDTIGHYGRWDVFDFRVGGRSLTEKVTAIGSSDGQAGMPNAAAGGDTASAAPEHESVAAETVAFSSGPKQ